VKKNFLFSMLLAGAGLLACQGEELGSKGEALRKGTSSPNAIWETVETMREDLVVPRDPSDGGGRAWIEPRPASTVPATAGAPGRWIIHFETGPRGISEGGALFFQISPFWGWTGPQVSVPDAPGFTLVETDAEGIELISRNLGQTLLRIEVAGRSLKEGEQIRITYGSGSGARADTYAEQKSPFWIAVDGNGDGVRKIIADTPTVDVEPGPPAMMKLILSSTARVDENLRLTVSFLDRAGNGGFPVEGEIVLEEPPRGLQVPERIRLVPADRGRKTVVVKALEEGIYRIRGKGPGSIVAESNPLLVSAEGTRILWGDLQIHSNFSDGTGTPEDLYLYARDVAALDVAAITDHDHWGMLFLDQNPSFWNEIRDQAARFHEPGRFVTLLGFEWTNWVHGHRHVLYFNHEGPVLSSLDPRYDTPQELWAALRGLDAISIAHHSAGAPVATNWEIPPDPELEPVTEVVSVHGSSEASDSPSIVSGAIPGNFVRDALDRGYRLGFLGSGDGHDGHPGFSQLRSRTGGMAAILSEELSRPGVAEALRARHVYATSGPRIILRLSLAGRRMGTLLRNPSREEELVLFAVTPAPIRQVDIIRSGKVLETYSGEGLREFHLRRKIGDLRAGEYLYVRVIQTDGGMAWSSPFFVAD
jgi:hypothetical protein